MQELIAPTTRLHTSWLEAHAEWGPGWHEDGFGLGPSDEVDSRAGFAAWVARLGSESDPAEPTEPGKHRCTYRWIVEGDRVLGGIALRHGSSDYVRRVLAVCAVDNVAGVKTIERCGGVFEGIWGTKFGPARRYWIEL